mmetsp:Transcript_61524/g.109471  ORF Transcript_61524/g.109471 Transcript_61524/m.109471 type:complete len:100 (+) Transcript_61524:229-528(+)
MHSANRRLQQIASSVAKMAIGLVTAHASAFTDVNGEEARVSLQFLAKGEAVEVQVATQGRSASSAAWQDIGQRTAHADVVPIDAGGAEVHAKPTQEAAL